MNDENKHLHFFFKLLIQVGAHMFVLTIMFHVRTKKCLTTMNAKFENLENYKKSHVTYLGKLCTKVG